MADQQNSTVTPTDVAANAAATTPEPAVVLETTVSEPAVSNQAEVAQKAQEKKSLFDSLKTGFLSSVNKLDQSKQKIAEEVATGKTAATKMTDQEKKDLMEAEKIYQAGLASIRDLIAPSAMEIRYDSLQLSGMFAQSFYVFSYPRYLDTNWLSPIVNFEVSMDMSQFIYPIDSTSIMKILRKKVTQMQASIHMDMEKGKTRDPGIETALQDAEDLRTEIQRGQEKFFQFALYFTVYAEDEKKLQKIAKQLESLLGGKLVLTRRAFVQAEAGLNSTLPLCLDEMDVIRNMNTSPLSTTFPFSSSTLTANEGILYGVNRHNDSLIIFDRFTLENANSVVFAKSGAGKSYAVKLEILRQMMLGTDVIVIDPENEYEALSQTVGGTYLKLSLNSDRRINPFDLPQPLEGEMVQAGDILRQNIISLLGLLKLMLGDLTPVEEGILDRALIDVYSIKGITMALVDPSKLEPPTMEDLYSILTSMEGASNLAQRLQKYTSGTYGGIFNKPTNIDLSSGMMVFSIRDLDDALRPIAMYIILNYIWSHVRRELKRRILVIDEAWSMMQHEDSAKFLFGLVKRGRKYYLGITTITQDVEDFLNNDHGKSIITNSSMQLLMKQSPAAVEALAKTFNLTEGEKYILLNSGVGQGLFFAGNKHAAIQIIASYGEDRIVTTNPQELLNQKKEQQG
jgi:type IV secretory pathway VirB4 component